MAKVIVAMSGGVDSSVAAHLLKEQGFEVQGVSFVLWDAGSRADLKTCCSFQSLEDASRSAHQIGIPHRIIDVRNDFSEKVIKPFVNAYVKGFTPNPCILCNRFIKFPFLFKEAAEKNAGYISTGHYARIETEKSLVNSHRSLTRTNDQSLNSALATRYLLKKGIDPKKDQSYFLYVLRQEELGKIILPLGYHKKNEVRKIAQDLNLSSVKRPESQEICFIEERNYFTLVEKLTPFEKNPGPVIDINGKEIGKHKGIYGYTVGQRKGLGISYPEPLYVIKIDAIKNTIYVGPREAAKKKEFLVEDLNWLNPPSSEKFRASVKVRSMMKDEPATIFLMKDENKFADFSGITNCETQSIARVVFDKPQWAPAPGQSAVFYDVDIIIGGGIIT
jgi:tRNA-specific 2-thiouridylase